MAKSLRSKRRRKMRAVKRVRYGEKELERLKKTLANDTAVVKKDIDEVMTDISEVATVSDAKTIKKKAKEQADSEVVDMEDDNSKHSFNNKTMKNQFGSYPVWMHPRKIKEKVKAFRKHNKANNKVTKKVAKKPKKKTKK